MRKELIMLLMLTVLSVSYATSVPTSIPKEVINAGAEKEFIDTVCYMARYHMARFMDGCRAVKEHFDSIASEYDWLTINTENITRIINEMENKINALCNATNDTYTQSVNELMALAEGSNGIEEVMKNVGKDIENQIKDKMSEYETQRDDIIKQVESIQAEIKPTTTQIESLKEQINNLQAQLEGVTDPSKAASLAAQINALSSNIQSLNNSIKDKLNELNSLQLQAESLNATVNALTDKLNKTFGDIKNKMESYFKGKDYTSLRAEAITKQLELFKKMFNYQENRVLKHQLEVENLGVKIEKYDKLRAWLANKTREAEKVFTVNSTDEEIMNFILEVKAEGDNWEKEIVSEIESKVSNSYITKLEEARLRAEAGVEQAKSAGLNTTILEEKIDELEEIRDRAHAYLAEGNYAAAYALLLEANRKYEQLRDYYNELRAQGEEAKKRAEEVMNFLYDARNKIMQAIQELNSSGVDTTTLQVLGSELDKIRKKIELAVTSGDYGEALKLTEEAKAKYDILKKEYEELKEKVGQ